VIIMSVADLRRRAKKYIKKKENAVVDTQKDVVKTAMNSLFNFSPHHSPNGLYGENFTSISDVVPHPGYTASGNYDANHKIASESLGSSGSSGRTYSKESSRAINTRETSRVENISDIGETVNIENTTNHVENVEYGFSYTGTTEHSAKSGRGRRERAPWKNIDAYRTYQRAENVTRSVHAGVLK